MSDPDRDPTVEQPDPSTDAAEPSEAVETAAEPAAIGMGEIGAVPARRSDPLAAGVAVLVMAALLGCAAIVLIAAGNA